MSLVVPRRHNLKKKLFVSSVPGRSHYQSPIPAHARYGLIELVQIPDNKVGIPRVYFEFVIQEICCVTDQF